MSKDTLAALIQIGNLKELDRAGWVKQGIQPCESVASHIYRTAMLALIIAERIPEVDAYKLVTLCVNHDTAESDPGVKDITPHDGVSNVDKSKRELHAMQKLSALLQSTVLEDLWLEYEEGKTLEAKLAKQIDKLELVVQAYEYERATGKDLSSFIEAVDSKIIHPVLRELFNELLATRLGNNL